MNLSKCFEDELAYLKEYIALKNIPIPYVSVEDLYKEYKETKASLFAVRCYLDAIVRERGTL